MLNIVIANITGVYLVFFAYFTFAVILINCYMFADAGSRTSRVDGISKTKQPIGELISIILFLCLFDFIIIL